MYAKYDELGRQVPDQTPVELPLGFDRPRSLQEMIKTFIRSEMSNAAAELGEESFEEADDFDVDEDPDPLSDYEMVEAQPEWPQGVKDVDGDPPSDPAGKTAPRASKAAGAASDDGGSDLEGEVSHERSSGDVGGRSHRGDSSSVENAPAGKKARKLS